MAEGQRQILLQRLEETAALLEHVFQSLPDTQVAVYDDWTARDVLAHLTFWHESFARNLTDLVGGK